jgi:predicted dehydrogenase
MKTVNYGIVGTGYFGAGLGRILKELPGAKVTCVYDPNHGEEIAKELSCDFTSDLESLCAREDVDCVVVATPNYLHKEPVLTAAQNGKNVFCEKPIALSYDDCAEMVEACQKAGVIFMAGHVMNFFNGVRRAKQFINEGKIGKILYCHSARNGWEPVQDSISWKKIRSKSGGHLYHHIHELDCIQFLMGMPEYATMVGGNVAHQGKKFGDEDDMLLISLEFPNNTYAMLEYGSAFRWSEHYLLIQGTEGAIRLDMKDAGMTVRTPQGEEHYLLHRNQEEDDDRTTAYNTKLEMDGAVLYGKPGKTPPLWLQGVMEMEMEYLNEIMHGHEAEEEFANLLNGKAARNSIATADACTKSIRENRKVALSEILGEAEI